MVVYLKSGDRCFIKLIKQGEETYKIDIFTQNESDCAIDVSLNNATIDEVFSNLVQGRYTYPSSEQEFNQELSKCISIINKANDNE